MTVLRRDMPGRVRPSHIRKLPHARAGFYWWVRGLVGVLVLLGIVVASRLHVAFSPCVFLRFDPVILACPLGTLEVTLAGHGVIWQLLPGFFVLCGLVFLLGRMWCGWVCPAHLAGHALGNASTFLLPGVARTVKKSFGALGGRAQLGRVHALGFLAGILVGAFIFRYPLWSILCPLGVVSRGLIEGSTQLTLRLELLVLILPILVLPLFRHGWKCACPVGVVHTLVARPNRTLIPDLRPEPDLCTECGVCQAACPVGLYPARELDTSLCTKCLRCMEYCPRNALSLRLKPGCRPALNMDRQN